MVDLSQAYASCARLAQAHYENFPVASRLLPRDMRDHVAAIYAFARVADDFADEGQREPNERLRLLDGWQARLAAAARGERSTVPPAPGEPVETSAIFDALGNTIRVKTLPVDLFEDLLSAFRQDVLVSSYATWGDLLDYCRRSANPIGRLVLRVSGRCEARLDTWSDAICTALQLTNFWQDAAVDAARGRTYLPIEAGTGPDAMDAARESTRAFFDAGRPLCDAITGRLRYQLRATWLGGMRVLDRLEQGEARPHLGARDLLPIAWKVVAW